MPGMFVVVEGPEGAGKSTLIARLAVRLEAQGRDVLVVREPGGTPTSEAARALVLDAAKDWESSAELFLMLTARAELVAKALEPALRAGTVVLCDRYDLSTQAYQIAGRGLPAEEVLAANRLATRGLRPDLTLVLDLPADEGRRRQQVQGKVPDRMERADAAMHERVARAFLEAGGEGLVHLDAMQPADRVEAQAWELLQEHLSGTAGA